MWNCRGLGKLSVPGAKEVRANPKTTPRTPTPLPTGSPAESGTPGSQALMTWQGVGRPGEGKALTYLVTVLGVLDVIWERRQWV